MALQTVYHVYYPPISTHSSLTGGSNIVQLLNANGQKYAQIFQAPMSGVLNRAEFFTGTVTVGGTMKLSFQGVNAATGDPDGVIGQFNTVTIANADDSVWKTIFPMTSDGAGGSKRTVTKGEYVAVVMEFNSFAGTESLNIQSLRPINSALPQVNHYLDFYNGTTWAKVTTSGPSFAIIYEGPEIYPTIAGGVLSSTTVNQSISSSTTPDEAGNLITLPFKCKVDGLYAASAAIDADIILYSGTTPLASAFIDKDIRLVATGQNQCMNITEVTLDPGSYRVVIRPTTTTAANMSVVTTPSDFYLKTHPDGIGSVWTQRTDGGAWSEIAGKKAFTGMRISALDDGVSGGGGGTGISRARVQGGM